MTEYFFARIGRSKIGRYLPTAVLGVCATTFYGYHSIGANLVKDFYAYNDAHGQRDTISVELRDLIKEVYLVAREKEKLTREFFESPLSQPPSITWFASSTLEPINLGMTEFRTGVTIGLPYFYNYKTHNDVPDDSLELRKLKLFRDPFKRKDKTPDVSKEDQELAKMISPETDSNGPKYNLIKKFDRNTDQGRAYLDTLVLSDDAKRFSIARELFLADSYRVPIKFAIITASGMAGIILARYSVSIFQLLKSPISIRIPYYILSFTYAYVSSKVLSRSCDQNYYNKSRDRAKRLGENYEKGAREYFEKRKLRRELLLAQDETEEY